MENQTDQPTEGWIQGHPKNQSKKIIQQTSLCYQNFIAGSSLYDPHMLGILRDLFPYLG